jgi:hypothetical protein
VPISLSGCWFFEGWGFWGFLHLLRWSCGFCVSVNMLY